MRYDIFQLKEDLKEARYMLFATYDLVESLGMCKKIARENYEKVYCGEIDHRGDIYETMDKVFVELNLEKPKSYCGHSLSVSDVITINGESYYVDGYGFVKLENF